MYLRLRIEYFLYNHFVRLDTSVDIERFLQGSYILWCRNITASSRANSSNISEILYVVLESGRERERERRGERERERDTCQKWRICRLDFSLVHAAACPINVVQMSECISVGCKRGSKWSSFIPRWFGYCDRESWQCREYSPFIRGPACRYCRSVSFLGSLLGS